MLSNRTLSTSSSTGGWERDVSARATEASRTDSGIGAIATSRRISRSYAAAALAASENGLYVGYALSEGR